MTPIRFAAAGLLLLAGTFSSASAQTSGRRPMTIADLITAVRVGDPRVSPDGQRVAFVRTTTDSATGKRNADIWVVAADGSGRPRPLIAGPGGDDNPRFLADGRIAFISARSGTPQVYLADPGPRRRRTRRRSPTRPPLPLRRVIRSSRRPPRRTPRTSATSTSRASARTTSCRSRRGSAWASVLNLGKIGHYPGRRCRARSATSPSPRTARTYGGRFNQIDHLQLGDAIVHRDRRTAGTPTASATSST